MTSIQDTLDVAIEDPTSVEENYLDFEALFADKKTPDHFTDYYIERIIPRSSKV
jgi:hypothetical protein